MSASELGKAFAAVAWLAIIIAFVVGWVWNIVTLFGFDGPVSEMGMMEMLRIIGIFLAPVGAVLGWM